jgi:uncharacterized protein (TIGR00369 family)
MTMRLQPNSKHCFVCGLESPVGLKLRFYDNGTDEVRALYTVDESYNSYPGVVHGGIIAAMLDEAAGRVIMARDSNRFMVTATLNIRYRNPVPTGVEVLVTSKLLKDKGRIAQAHSEIRLSDGTLCSEAEVTLVAISLDQAAGGIDMSELGWQLYPDLGRVPPAD